jgi:hypothetical protein
VPGPIAAHRLAQLVSIGCVFAAASAQAHGFGQRYDLPIPLSFYLLGAGATVALSFVIAAIFLRTPDVPGADRRLPLLRSGAARRCAHGLALVMRAAGGAYFVLMVVAGEFGAQSPLRNIIVVSVWIVGWVAISLCSALVGDVWRLVNPWDTFFRAAERIHAHLRPGRSLSFRWPYPAALDRWPAVLLLVAFAWMELVWAGRDVPARLAGTMLLYSALTWLGMLAFGRQAWLERAEVFTIVFGIFARFAPLASAQSPGSELVLRLPGSGLLDLRETSRATMLLVVTLLATVTFDGILDTPLWARVDIAIIDAPDDSWLWTIFDLSEAGALRLGRTIGLVAFVMLFSATYLAICHAMATAARGKHGAMIELGRRFVFTLLPISIAYHNAHYFSYLLNGGQLIIPLLSDPFGFGWNLLGTASYQPDIGLVGPLLQWSVAVGAIVVGHVIAVYLAHATALSTFRGRRRAMLSQMPIVILMVCYTMLSLWILSQPIVETNPGG